MSPTPVSVGVPVIVAIAFVLLPFIFLAAVNAPVISVTFNVYCFALEFVNVPNLPLAPEVVTLTNVTLAVLAQPDVTSCTLSLDTNCPNTPLRVITLALTDTTIPFAPLSSP